MSDAPPQDLISGITTQTVFDDPLPSLRVLWIAWDSPFRKTDLRPADLITQVNGTPIERAQGSKLTRYIGQYDESQGWGNSGMGLGSVVKLQVRRRNMPGIGWTVFEASGPLVARANYRSAGGEPALSPDGPISSARDDFDSTWDTWYNERLVPKFSRLLSGAWREPAFNNRYELRQHEEAKARIDYATAHYPGPFSQILAADWEAVRDALSGEKVDLSDADLRYRRAEEEKIQSVREAAQAAFTAFRAAIAPETIPASPAIDPTVTDPKDSAGKYIVMPPIRNSDWLDNGGFGFFAFPESGGRYWFANTDSPGAQAMLMAAQRYRRLVSTSLAETYTIIARSTGTPTLKTINGRGYYGVLVDVAAAIVGDAMFVDLTEARDGFAAFAGEKLVDQPMHALPAANASPAEVLEAMVGALKLGDEKLWKALFVDWRMVRLDDGRFTLYMHENGLPDQYWSYSRENLQRRVYGMRVAWVGDARTIMTGSEFPGSVRMEEVEAEIDHIGLFDGEYRVFKDLNVNRVWTLQRIGQGPWRIASFQQI